MATRDKRIFKRSDYDPNWREVGDDWTVDLGVGDTANPDCYWHFRTRRDAAQFLALVDGGMTPRDAQNAFDGQER
jgi:hypothetical protein